VSVAAPLYLAAAALAAAGVIVLHYIVMRQPPRDIFPTARFLPIRAAVVRTWARRPEHVLLLLLRALGLGAIGLAFARPIWRPRRAAVAHIVIADRGRDVAAVREVADSARRLIVGAPDVLIAFDSGPAIIATHMTDSLTAFARRDTRGNISAALIGALRASAAVRALAESIEVVLISPAAPEELDAATDSIRALWPGAIRLARVTARRDTAKGVSRMTVRWPDTARVRARMDTATAVISGGATVIAPFERRWVADTDRGVVIARWIDGEPAAAERATSDGCVRSVVVPVPVDGDLALRPEFVRFANAMHAACGAAVQRTGGEWSAAVGRPLRVAAAQTPIASTPLVAWLLGAAIVLVLAEMVIRR